VDLLEDGVQRQRAGALGSGESGLHGVNFRGRSLQHDARQPIHWRGRFAGLCYSSSDSAKALMVATSGGSTV